MRGRDRKEGVKNFCMLLLLFLRKQQVDTQNHFCYLYLLLS